MADLSITPANVERKSGSKRELLAGEAINAGEVYYVDASGKAQLADCTDADKDEAAGIALCDAAAEQPLIGADRGATLDLGVTLTDGETYVLSEAGKICPVSDLLSTEYVTYIGFKDANGYLDTSIMKATGVAKA